MVKDTGRSDDKICFVGRPVGHLDLPTTVLERAMSDLHSVLNQPIDPIAMRDVLEIRLDLGARRKAMAPIRVGRE